MVGEADVEFVIWMTCKTRKRHLHGVLVSSKCGEHFAELEVSFRHFLALTGRMVLSIRPGL